MINEIKIKWESDEESYFIYYLTSISPTPLYPDNYFLLCFYDFNLIPCNIYFFLSGLLHLG